MYEGDLIAGVLGVVTGILLIVRDLVVAEQLSPNSPHSESSVGDEDDGD